MAPLPMEDRLTMTRWLLASLLVLATLAPALAGGTGTPFTLYLSAEPDGVRCPRGVLIDSPQTSPYYECSTTPSTIHELAPVYEKVYSVPFTQKNAFAAATTLGSDANLTLFLASYVGVPHPLLRLNVTLDLVDGATTSLIGWADAPCPFIPYVTAPSPNTWTCSLNLPLVRADAPAGSLLVLTVTYTQDESPASPSIGFYEDPTNPNDHGASHLVFSG